MGLLFEHLKKTRHLAFASITFFLLALVFDAWFLSENYNKLIVRKFQTRFVQEQNELELRIDNLLDFLKKSSPSTITFRKTRELRDLASEREMFLYVYKNYNDSLVYWSDNAVPEADILPVLVGDHKLIQLANAWYFSITKDVGEYRIIGLLLIKNNYGLQNRFLNNSFNPIFNLSPNAIVKTSTLRAEHVVMSNNGNPAFSIWFNDVKELSGWNLVVVLLFFATSFAFLFVFARRLIKQTNSTTRKISYLLAVGLLLLVIKSLMGAFKFPDFLFQTSLFQPIHFAQSNFLPSLGDLFFFSCIVYFIIFNAYTEIKAELSGKIKNQLLKLAIRVGAVLFLVGYFLYANELFESVVYNSNLSFETRELNNVGYISVVGVLSIALLFAGFIFIADYSFRTFFASVSIKKTIITAFITIASCLIIYTFIDNSFDVATLILLALSVTIIIYTRNLKHANYRYTQIILLVLVFSFYSVYVIYRVSSQKAENEKKLLVSGLAQEHDPVAEYLIVDLNKNVKKDTILKRKLFEEPLDFPWIYKYTRKKYFSGYWERYDLQLTICNETDSVLVKPELISQPCFGFFNSLVQKNGEEIKGSGFYYLKNPNGRISYLSLLGFRRESFPFQSNIYLQLDSKLSGDEIGYPELLLDEKFSKQSKSSRYSYAKYNNRRLIYQSGNFQYNLNLSKYFLKQGEYAFDSYGGYEHIIYKPNNETHLILSKPESGLFDLLVSFSYLFIFYFIVLNFILLAASPQWFKINFKGGFKARIRLAVISILFLSLISVGGVTIYFIINQYENKHYEIISEKLQSIYLELENNLAHENKISYTWKSDEYNNLEELLRRLSNVFYTDINLYDANGRMIATSRSEVFDKGISGTLINTMAYYQLSRNNKLEHIQTEHLGDLKYLSVYAPFFNSDNKLLAYLNLPYFTRQSLLSEEISSMLLAIINFYIILILVSLSLAIFISEKISEPLRKIQDSFAKMKLGTKNEKILYEAKDEIGELVSEYNRMVDELEHSVDLLARSERESAWREMAKQVAHEIKNPLTPMKLSIQQLQRAWNDKHEDLDTYFKRVTKTLIEQIEHLSNIATEFSNFAKMPKAQNETFDLVSLLIDVISLYNEGSANIIFTPKNNVSFYVFADKEQISRVFINLITNALQAVPEERVANVKVLIEEGNKEVIVKISDNGMGISDELISKMFQPNFTTKSGGMGLGLAICKNVVENCGGDIRFETSYKIGTTFIVKLPCCQ